MFAVVGKNAHGYGPLMGQRFLRGTHGVLTGGTVHLFLKFALVSTNFALGVYLCMKCTRYTFGIKSRPKGVFVYQSVSDTPSQGADFCQNPVNSVFFP